MKSWLNKQLGRINYLAWELILTLSSKQSLFSSKRLERAILFNCAVSIIMCFSWYRRSSITAVEIIAFVGLMGTWAGFNVKQIQREKKADGQEKNENIITDALADKIDERK